MFDFKEQVVLITGGTGGLGQVIAQEFLSAGAKLALPDRSHDKIKELFPELVASPDHYLADGVDLTAPEQVSSFIKDALAHLGKIDILVNTVGGYKAGTPVHQTPLETWDFMMNLNARSILIVCQAVLPGMIERKSGKIVNVGARPALSASGNDSAYSASKSALARLTESMAAEYKRQGITVNSVLPSMIVSEQDLENNPDAGVTARSLAQVIMFLCSDAARIINGALIPAYGTRF